MVNGERYQKAIKEAKTKAEAEAEADLIFVRIREGEFSFLKDGTKFSAFADEVYLPYCKLSNANYSQKKVECKMLKKNISETFTSK